MEIRRLKNRRISPVGFPVLVRWHFYIELAPTWRDIDCHPVVVKGFNFAPQCEINRIISVCVIWGGRSGNSSSANNHFVLHHKNTWKPFPCHWPFVRGTYRSPVDYPHKGKWQLRCRWFETPSRSLWRHCNYFFNNLCYDVIYMWCRINYPHYDWLPAKAIQNTEQCMG